MRRQSRGRECLSRMGRGRSMTRGQGAPCPVVLMKSLLPPGLELSAALQPPACWELPGEASRPVFLVLNAGVVTQFSLAKKRAGSSAV